jgi:hypothetical protein
MYAVKTNSLAFIRKEKDATLLKQTVRLYWYIQFSLVVLPSS